MKDNELWSRLPVEILEQVLSLLPIPDLCRCCAVCKGWNSLISTSQFASRCLQNHAAKEGQSYVVARWIAELDLDADPSPAALDLEPESYGRRGYLGWSILDVEAKRWYRLNHHEHVDGFECLSMQGCMAADRGLVCEYTGGFLGGPCVRISNPLTNHGIRILPAPPKCLEADPRDVLMNFVVDNIDSSSFKVFFIRTGFTTNRYCYPGGVVEPFMYVYDSGTELWRSSSNPNSLLDKEGFVGYLGSTVMFQGRLYVLFSSSGHYEYCLFSYDILEDVWEDTGIHIRSSANYRVPTLSQVQLLVSDDRLFLVYWGSLNRFPDACCGLHIDEVLLADADIQEVFQMTPEVLLVVFHLAAAQESKFQAFGFQKSVILMSEETGVSLLYDLESALWSQLPASLMDPLPDGYELWFGDPVNRPQRRTAYQLWSGKVMSLRLPSLPW
ncbi:hypothetical protein M758_12G075400 [Ceratodon purpureus]|nr:hypothetical protein M758_12G075400 [Ceratodon purpureus]